MLTKIRFISLSESSAVVNAEINPTITQGKEIPSSPSKIMLTSADPTIIGKERRKVNEALLSFFSPTILPAKKTVPLRDSPGNNASPCDAPIIADCKNDGTVSRFLGLYSKVTVSKVALNIKVSESQLPEKDFSATPFRAKTNSALTAVATTSERVSFERGFFTINATSFLQDIITASADARCSTRSNESDGVEPVIRENSTR